MSAYRDYLKTLGTWSGTREEWNESLFNAGMTRAAEICDREKLLDIPDNDGDRAYMDAIDDCKRAILAARDGK